MATGANGCDGVVPAGVPPRLSWTAPNASCGAEGADREGNIAASLDDASAAGLHGQLFLPSDASAGFVVANDATDSASVIPRPVGFFIGHQYTNGEWLWPVGPEGMAEGSAVHVDGFLPSLVPNPKGGYVEERGRLGSSSDGATKTFELRWVDAALNPRTPWWPVASWIVYPPGDTASAVVDVFGNALVVKYTFSRGVPCAGITGVDAFWVLEDGSVSPFAPMIPTYAIPSGECGSVMESVGSALALDDGGIAFFAPFFPTVQVTPSGWYARYSRGSAERTPPSWLADHGPALQRLANGAYLETRRDPTTCARTAEIVGPAGQSCATLALAGSNDCAAADRIFPDGTLILEQASASCSLVWWPSLGGPR